MAIWVILFYIIKSYYDYLHVIFAAEIAQYLVYNPLNGVQTVSLDTSFLTPIKEPRNMDFKVTVFDLDARYDDI